MKPSERFRRYRQLLSSVAQNRSFEERLGARDFWRIYERDRIDYEFEFKDLFPGEDSPLWNFVHERRTAGKSTVALDILSEGEALRTLAPDAGLSIAITDQRSEDQKQFDAQQHLSLIAGDVLRRQTWQMVQQWLNETEDQQFHLILERGSGPLATYPDDPALEHKLINHLWGMLSKDHGLMVLQLPIDTAQRLPRWAEQMNCLNGVTVAYSITQEILNRRIERSYPIVKFTKDSNAPDTLPVYFS